MRSNLACLPLAFANATSAKYVFAHFMAQNSYSYSQSDWSNDITTAHAIGIDGFALNIAANDYEVDRIADAYAVAEPLGFQFFYSFDMSSAWSQSDMVSIVAAHAHSSSTFRYEDAVLVSTYSGESLGDSFWSTFKSTLQAQGIAIKFAPAFTSYRDPSQADSLISTFPSIDGFFNWWSWPADVGSTLTTNTDLAYQQVAEQKGGPYIMSVSPWQFKNLGGENDWVELSDTLWNYRWQQAINDVNPDIVEIVTWNDYAESHYIGDINPNVDLGTLAPLYVDGFVHSPWRTVAQYYISWYKNGSPPPIGDDSVVFWYRAHPKDAVCTNGARPRNADFPADAIFALALLSDNATISLDVGSSHAQFDAGPGATIGSVPFPSEDSQIPFIQIIKNGQTVKSGYGSEYITQNCDYYNFNPWVGILQ
ncbi:hypothetical protein EW026_g1960 [Hermanssonia centrifuga]|uniref:Glycoside hydrolase family 71 protein n=1 Tax=Hermanssonia centrifuga TaxID=98765 RepID=A0A4S4KRN1_9APHY|nr:hypothetical protein EW026_g1960 [Hermanssonia centrifuga]